MRGKHNRIELCTADASNIIKDNEFFYLYDVETKGICISMKKISQQNLYNAILSLETQEECRLFFEDICTIKELETMSQRLEVAKMLVEKRVYSDIVKETGASTATISRVNRSLTYGNEGYDLVFSRIKK